jgi:hypothetical protein
MADRQKKRGVSEVRTGAEHQKEEVAKPFDFLPVARIVVESFRGRMSMQELKLAMMVDSALLKELIDKVEEASVALRVDLSREEVGAMVAALTEEDTRTSDRIQATERSSTNVFESTSFPPPSTQPQDTLGQVQTRAFNVNEPPRHHNTACETPHIMSVQFRSKLKNKIYRLGDEFRIFCMLVDTTDDVNRRKKVVVSQRHGRACKLIASINSLVTNLIEEEKKKYVDELNER